MYQATQFRRRRAGLIFFLGVAPDGVYTDPACHHAGGELLPRLFILTYYCRRLFSVALSLRFPSQDVILHHCSMEPGLSSPPPVSPEEDDDEAATVWSASARSIEGLRALVTPRCAFQSPVSRRYYVKHGRYCHKPRGMLRPTYLCWSIR